MNYGLYANALRGKVKKAGLSPSALRLVEEDLKRIPSKGWAEMIRKVHEVDPMVCPKCGGRGERGILLIIRARGERKSIVFHPVRRGFRGY
jgi:hypothetical protein